MPRDASTSRERVMATDWDESKPTTCDECGLTYFYAPKLHECADKGKPAPRPMSWVEESMRKVGAWRGDSSS